MLFLKGNYDIIVAFVSQLSKKGSLIFSCINRSFNDTMMPSYGFLTNFLFFPFSVG